MRGSSRHGASRPERAGGRSAGPGRGAGRDRGQAAVENRRPALAVPDPERLAGLIAPVVSAAGLDLELVKAAAAGKRLLVRVVVDADGGVPLDDIADISREVAAALDDAGVMGEAPYTLEVSSPGVDRPLTEPRHWRRATGRLVRAPQAPAAGAGAGRSADVVEGRVVDATDEAVTLEIGGAERTFRYRELGPGRVQVEFGRLAEEIGDLDGGEPDGH